jgi:hypothetical protein
VTTRSGSLGQQRREPKQPSIHRDVVDLDATLGEQFLDVAVRQPEAQIPTDRQHNHLGRKAKAGEGSLRDGTKGRAASSRATVWLRDAVATDATVPDHDPGSGQLRRQPYRPPRGPLTEGAITRTMHLVAANRSDSCAAVTTSAVLTILEARGQVPVG